MSDLQDEGGCRCGAIRYRISGTVAHASICHCTDCRRSAGAPCVAWAGIPEEAFQVTQGQPRHWSGNGEAHRYFCADCGTGIYYTNEQLLPGQVDVAIATLDHPERCPPEIQVQSAEKLTWLEPALASEAFARFPE